MKVARFEKVSEKQFRADGGTSLEDVILPYRATSGSAGYDLFLPHEVTLEPNQQINIPTGLRCKIANGWVLLLMPKSGLGCKYRLGLANTVAVVDSDYYNAVNEGHLIVTLVNNGNQTIELKKGRSFVQGLFVNYGITEDDNAVGIRTGGWDSTNKI